MLEDKVVVIECREIQGIITTCLYDGTIKYEIQIITSKPSSKEIYYEFELEKI